MNPIAVFAYSDDPLVHAGIVTMLRPRQEIHIVEPDAVDQAAVAIIAVDEVDQAALRTIRGVQRNGCPRVVVVSSLLDDAGVLGGVEAGVCGFIRRLDVSPERLVALVKAAADGEGSIPPDLLGRLLSQVSQLHAQVLAPQGFGLSGVSDREIGVLRLVAEGLDTNEIATRLCYSERTVKAIIHDVTTRLCLKNRSHAVAYAVRQGLI